MNCAICNRSLEVRAELKTVVNPAWSRYDSMQRYIQKHVRVKPRQVVITVRAEGSSGPEGPAFRGLEVRLCTHCANGKNWLELLAVWLDRALEGRPR